MDELLTAQGTSDPGEHYRDPASGLYQKDFFLLELDREFFRSARSGDPFTVAFVDFHAPAGDQELLKKLGSIVGECIRDVDLACRYEEELFALLLLKTSAEVAHVAGERIRRAVHQKLSADLPLSVGMASFPVDAPDKEGLIRKAGSALKQARQSQDRRVFFFSRPSAESTNEKPRVLIVDDDRRNVKLLEGYLLPENYEVLQAFSGEEALTMLGQHPVDLILLDIMMPGLDGYEVCKRAKSRDATRFIPIILITALGDSQARIRGYEAGADDFLSKPANREELLARTRALIRVRELNRNLISVESALVSLANAVEAKDDYTYGHLLRMANLTESLGTRLQMPQKDIFALRQGAILHDVGKIGVAKEIINKPGKLDAAEWEEMKTHPEIGYQICLPLKANLGLALDVIRHHHEKLDGSSYPDGLAGDEISLAARIVGVADIYDALVSDRPYRKAMPKARALEILQEEVGQGKLDQRVVDELIDLVQ